MQVVPKAQRFRHYLHYLKVLQTSSEQHLK
jgi:hypothetical protein